MQDKQTRQLVMKISDEILALVDDAPDMTRGDVQSAAEAIALQVVMKYYQVDPAA